MVGTLELAAALLLVGAGGAKLVAPASAAAMLRRAWARLPTPEAAIRAAAVVELAVGLAVLVRGDRASSILLGCCYLGFAALTLRLIGMRTRASCGCFGRAGS